MKFIRSSGAGGAEVEAEAVAGSLQLISFV
jgi:hypothetical protein